MTRQVGIVVVSHSLALAEAALGLALEMVAQNRPPIALAAGTADGGFGTDAVRVAEAIGEVDRGAGVVVLTDLGSAVLSAEMALEFLPDPDTLVRIVPAPFVEGLLAAVVRAAGGAGLDEVADEAARALSGKIEQLGGGDDAPDANGERGRDTDPHDRAPDATRTVAIVNPAGLHARPAAAVAAAAAAFEAAVIVGVGDGSSQKPGVPALSALGLAGLGTRAGDTVTISAIGPDAEAAVSALAELIASGFGEVPDDAPTSRTPHEAGEADTADTVDTASAPGRTARVLVVPETADRSTADPSTAGLGVSSGRVVGRVLRMPDPLPPPDTHARVPAPERGAAAARLSDATRAVAERLRARAETASGSAAEILSATAMLASDPLLLATATETVRERGLTPEAAIAHALDDVAAQFAEAGGLQAERVSDIADIRTRIIAELEGVPVPGVPESGTPFVLVAGDLAPADTVDLDPANCLAIVLAEGGPTSHTAILARSLEIPAVVASPIARHLVDGDTVLVDGDTGEVVRDPDAASVETARTAPVAAADRAPLAGPGATADGVPVAILANIGGPQDVAAAVERGAEGVGLFRTEFSFLGRDDAPSREEQAEAYRRVLAGFPGRRVVIRTLDAGSDKPLPFLAPDAEENPALGVRGYRTATRHPEVLADQLAAIVDAAHAVPESEPWVMAPMIATVAEAAEFASAARAAGLERVGVMIETPAAALMAEQIFEHVDFVSLGTNDLAQYTMAADRLSGELAALGDPWQPAVLKLIERCTAGSNGKPVGVCGEAASDPLLARVLVGLGVTSLSMSARAVPAVGAAVSSGTHESYKTAAAAALAAPSAAEAKVAARQVLEPIARRDEN